MGDDHALVVIESTEDRAFHGDTPSGIGTALSGN